MAPVLRPEYPQAGEEEKEVGGDSGDNGEKVEKCSMPSPPVPAANQTSDHESSDDCRDGMTEVIGAFATFDPHLAEFH